MTGETDLETIIKHHHRIFDKIRQDNPGKEYYWYVSETERRLITYFKAYGISK